MFRRDILLGFVFNLLVLTAFGQSSNDDFVNAIDIDTLKGTESAEAEYSTANCTPDLNEADMWNIAGGDSLHNVWFKFSAPQNGAAVITLDRGGSKGTQTRSLAAIWESDGTTEINSIRYDANGDDIVIAADNLTPGGTYYLSVDAQRTSSTGSFTLGFDSILDYDFISAALNIDAIKGSSSTDAEYTTIGASPDGLKASCWNGSGPFATRWFEFTAADNGVAVLTVDIGGTKGDQIRTQAALWSSDGTTELACSRYDANGDDVEVSSVALTPGNTYLLSVDVQALSRRGSFSLNYDTIPSHDYIAGAINIDTLKGTSSSDAEYTTVGGSADGLIGSNWNNSGPLYNKWFSFTAPSTGEVKLTVDVGDAKGTQEQGMAAIWQSDATTEEASSRYSDNSDDIVVSAEGLTPGNTYYLSVDARNNRFGTFTIDFDTVTDYSFFDKAIDIDTLLGKCSSDAEYTTKGSTADLNTGSAWNNSGPLLNRWFKFTAPSTQAAEITVDIDGLKGDQTRTQLALWSDDGVTEISSARYSSNSDDVTVGSISLTSGDTYYLSVDVNNYQYAGSFSLCIDTTPSYDYFAGAIDIDTLKGTCSADAEYTTVNATADLNVGTNWNNSGPLYNRWFRFTAAQNGTANFTVDIDGTKGNQERTQLAIWESDGTTEVVSDRYDSNTEDVTVGSVSLIAGNTYYVSVDVQALSRVGTFTLCYDTIPTYDFYEGAVDVTSILGSCSDDAVYTTDDATPDGTVGSCWNNSGPLFNRWFKFTAPTLGAIKITADIGDGKGTQTRSQLALWESDGSTPVLCGRYASNDDDVELNSNSLTGGATYYISVDAYGSNYVGTFSLCIDTTPSYDFKDGAVDVTSLFGGCSDNAEYTTIGGTADLNAGANWNNSGPLYNRWFMFTAPTNGIANITVDIENEKGTQRRTQLAVWESDGTTEINSARYDAQYDDVALNLTGLTGGDTYYISVDAYNSSNDGSFTLCMDSTPSYDYIAGAIELTDLNSWSSTNEAYTTVGASADLNAGSNWNNSGPLYNRWFKFTALSSDFTVRVDVAGDKGTQRRTQLAIWESDGITEVASARYSTNTDSVSITENSLTIGNEYYISVDVQSVGQRGSFSLFINGVGGAHEALDENGKWDDVATWSTGNVPESGDIVNIEDAIVYVDNNDTIAGINLNVNSDSTGIVVQSGGRLVVLGSIRDTSSVNFYGGITVENGGVLEVSSDMIFLRSGGNEVFELDIQSGGELIIGNDLTFTSTGGTTTNTTFDIEGEATIGNMLTLEQSGSGMKTQLTINSGGELNVDNFTLSSAADDKVEIELNGTAIMNVTGSLTRGTPAYGIIDGNGTSTVNFNGSGNQILPGTDGSGTGDELSFQNVIVNNSFSSVPQVRLGGDFTFTGDFAFTNGVISGEGFDFTVPNLATTSGGSANSYLDGKMIKNGGTDFTFQVGDGAYWAPLDFEYDFAFPAEEFEVEYFSSGYSDTTTVGGGELVRISTDEYWDIEHSAGTSPVDITFHFKDSARSQISDVTDVVIGHFDGSDWESYGASASSSGFAGSVTASNIINFSPLSFGFKTPLSALPVELISFDAERSNNGVRISWLTAAEINNERFEIERSYDGKIFELVQVEFGQGNTFETTNYSIIDNDVNLNSNVVYYRLKQVDFDGTYVYSDVVIVLTGDSDNASAIDIYPNPNTGNLIFLKATDNLGDFASARLLTSSGVMVAEVSNLFVSSKTYSAISIENKPNPGVYFLEISGKGNTVYKKVVFR